MAQGRVTIVDVASRAGVSKSAVSFALNGRPGLAEETRQRILDVAREMGWSPSQRGRSLAVSRAFAVGLILARAPELIGSDPFYPSFIAGAEAVLSKSGYSLLLQVLDDPAREADAYHRLATEGRVDGVFLSDMRHGDPRIAMLTELGLPAVTLNRSNISSPFPAVCLDDNAPGITVATRHLIELGHRRIAHVTGPVEFMHAVRRRDAWGAALADAGVPEGPVVVSDFTASGGAAATRELLSLEEPPTAIVYANDLMAMAGMVVAQDLGFPVPQRLSVTGFDDTELAAYVSPALTTVRTSPFAWGQHAAQTLLQFIDAGSAPDVELDSPELVIRTSTARPLEPPLT
ncbi:LacI family transcriptional regulator [Streptomyces sp. RB6PN25]|uniref:LacI family transcriptional regulator n=1 Tax=Streptomyces humicola TaxID=2953240 RepID=A0ABT1PTA0_9ACTN|nr:LacI family DNA-binding transcriptional regulator [Streptomyces humicola]MCQ4080895.1 LacI family transcriptional regulator [Streptomyces humicola]